MLVDWCDAYAYCAAVGKRLCGKIGGGSISLAEATASPNSNQWINACSAHGANDYVFGDTYVDGKCYCANYDGSSKFVGTMPDCQSPVTAYSKVYDLSGNVEEWEDNCTSGQGMSATCNTRGGSFIFWDTQMMCNQLYGYQRSSSKPYVGFRCCTS